MSVDNHKHCQVTVLSANGRGDGDGNTWRTIYNLRNDLPNISPTNWINQFNSNRSNITEDFATVLKLLNSTAESLSGSINGLNNTLNNSLTNVRQKLTNIEGQLGQLNSGKIVCYIAPKDDYFKDNSGVGKLYTRHDGTNGTSKDEDGRIYYTLNEYDPGGVPNCSYSYNKGSEKRLYPGSDETVSETDKTIINLEKQYNAENEEEKKKYPVFSPDVALEYLRRFRANGVVDYIIKTQYGEYHFGTTAQTIRLIDAKAGSTLYIGPSQTPAQLKQLPCTQPGYTGFTNSGQFDDDDLVKVKFIWDDNSGANGAGRWYFYLRDSNTKIDGIGFSLNRNSADSWYKERKTNSLLLIIPQSGQVRFSQCVFRNAAVGSQNAESPSPQIIFWEKNVRPVENYDTAGITPPAGPDYTLDHINYWQLPNVFVDDPPMIFTDLPNTTSPEQKALCINYPYIQCGNSENSVIQMEYSFLVIRARRKSGSSPISIGSSNSVRWFWASNHLSKLLLCYENETSTNTSNEMTEIIDATNAKYRSVIPVELRAMSITTVSQGTTPSNAKNKKTGDQTRFEIVNKDKDGRDLSAPDWLQSPEYVFSNKKTGYDPETGSLNNMSGYFTHSYGTVMYNRTKIDTDTRRKCKLDHRNGVNQTYLFVYAGLQMLEVPVPVKDGYVFDGYWKTDVLVNPAKYETQYYTPQGKSARPCDFADLDYSDNILYAKWLPRYKLILNANGGSIVNANGESVSTTTKTIVETRQYGDLPEPIWDGYTFDGWYTEMTGGDKKTSDSTVKLSVYNSDDYGISEASTTLTQTLYAHWTPTA